MSHTIWITSVYITSQKRQVLCRNMGGPRVSRVALLKGISRVNKVSKYIRNDRLYTRGDNFVCNLYDLLIQDSYAA